MPASQAGSERGLLKRGVLAIRDNLQGKISDLFLALAHQIPSSGRDAESYRENLFPEFGSGEELVEYLLKDGKFIVDIGSGLTHKNPYSLINVVARATGKVVTFMGIEPKVGGLQGGFSKADKLLLLIDKFLSDKKKKQTHIHTENRIVAAELPELPLPDKSVDLILSSFLLGRWIEDPKELLKTFKEFDRILSEKGEIRLYPFSEKLLEDKDLRDFIGDCFIQVKTTKKRLLILKRKPTIDKSSE